MPEGLGCAVTRTSRHIHSNMTTGVILSCYRAWPPMTVLRSRFEACITVGVTPDYSSRPALQVELSWGLTPSLIPGTDAEPGKIPVTCKACGIGKLCAGCPLVAPKDRRGPDPEP